MDDPLNVTLLGGLLIGAMFGAIVQRSNYCIMGAVADFAISGDLRRMRAWMLAIAVAILCSQALHLAGQIDLSRSFYRSTQLPLGALLFGGLLFGFGMVIACGCSSRSLVNAATGDLRAFVALVILGVFAYITLHGLLAWPRVWLTRYTQIDLGGFGAYDSGLGPLLGDALGLAHGKADTLISAVFILALGAFALLNRQFRQQRGLLLASIALGALIAAGWYVTGVIGADEFEPRPLLSLRFVAPIGDSLQFTMLFSGMRANFGIATVGGVLLGAFAAAWAGGKLQLRAFEDLHDLRRYLCGGALMGAGGVLSLGCTVGQGMSGVSTLALGSLVATAAIIAGGILGVRYLEHGSLIAVVRARGSRHK